MRVLSTMLVTLAIGCATAEDDAEFRPTLDASSDARGDTRADGAGGDADAGGCGAGRTPCGASCVTLDNNVDHCGACNDACPTVTNAVRTCAAGKCGFSCNTGWDRCGSDTGCDTNLRTNPQHCGACGKVCPTTPTTDATCTASVCGASCKAGYVDLGKGCTNFGGAFEEHTPACTSCHNGNPYTSGSCTCPSGTSPSFSYAVQNDACGSVRSAWLTFCESAGPAVDVWGGAYQADDPVSCSVACRVTNSKTGACSCPAGFTGVSLRALIATSCGTIGTNLVVCVHPTAVLADFGGVYQLDDSVAGGRGCRVANPRTGGCACPAGFSGYPLRSIVDSSAGAIGSQIFWCAK